MGSGHPVAWEYMEIIQSAAPKRGLSSDQSVRPHYQAVLTLVLTESSGSAMVQLSWRTARALPPLRAVV